MENCYEVIEFHEPLIRLKGKLQVFLDKEKPNFDSFGDKAIFKHNGTALNPGSNLTLTNLSSLKSSSFNYIEFELVFSYSSNECNTPVINFDKSLENKCNTRLYDFDLVFHSSNDKISYENLRDQIDNFCVKLENASKLLECPIYHVEPYYFIYQSKLVKIFYSKKFSDKDKLIRAKVHKDLNVPTTIPHFRRYQSIFEPYYFSRNLGPNEEVLVNPHESLKSKGDTDNIFIVKGKYSYKHYLQDKIDDDKWGCAYRSLQTIVSWLIWQDYISYTEIPSLRKIQETLVSIKEKPVEFLNSKQWIGSLEISFVIQSLYNVQCRIIPLKNIKEIIEISQEIAEHFDSNGGPIMIGGGQLAHTIIGVDLTKSESPQFLVLDPHYTGTMCDIGNIISKKFVCWRDVSFWKANTSFNLCLCPPFPELDY